MSNIECEIGAKYLTRDGKVVVLKDICESGTYPYFFKVEDGGYGFSTTKSGSVYGDNTECDKDIIKKLEVKSMKPHKWAKEIHAWADGAKIQIRFDASNEWQDVTLGNINWEYIGEYRIKPKPVKVKYRVALVKDELDNIEPRIIYPNLYEMTNLCSNFIRWIPDHNGNIDYEVEV